MQSEMPAPGSYEPFRLKEKIGEMMDYGRPLTKGFSRKDRDLADGLRDSMLKMYHLAVELEKKYYRKTTAQELDVELEWLRNLVRMAADKDLCGAKFAPPLSIRPVRQGVEFVGVRIWPTHMKLRKSTVRRIKREVRKISALYAAGDMTQQDFYRRVASIRGLLKHTESASLRWRLNEIYRAELEKGEQKRLREEAQHEPFADHSGAGNGDGNAGTGYQDHGNPACRAG